MKSKKNQRLLALILSMVLMLSASISAMAEGEMQTEASGTEVTQNQVDTQSLEASADSAPAEEPEAEVQEPAEEQTAAETPEEETASAGSDETTQTEVPETDPVQNGETQSTEPGTEGSQETVTEGTEESTAAEEQTPAEEVVTEEVVSEAAELKQEFTDENGNVIQTITAYVPEGAFQTTADQISMEASFLNADDTDYIKGMMEELLPENYYLGGYVLYRINFKVNGEITEPAKAITITMTGNDLEVEDTQKAHVFYYDPEDPETAGDEDQLAEVIQKDQLIKSLQESGQSTANIEDYDYSEIAVNEGNADSVTVKGWESTIYGCYVEKEAVKELTYEDDTVKVTVSADEMGIIPNDTTLQVVAISKEGDTEDQYKEVEKRLQEKAEKDDYEIAGFLAYDISFVDENGDEVEPNGEVRVSMEYKKAAAPEGVSQEDIQDAEVSMMHLEEDENGEVKDVVDMTEADQIEVITTTEKNKVEKVAVKTESFSNFVITWSKTEAARATGPLNIEDEIVEDGSLHAVYNDESRVTEYRWYKADSENRFSDTPIERVVYVVDENDSDKDVANISEDGSRLYPAIDGGARKWYKVEALLEDGTIIESDPMQVPYYDELQNGGFETPAYMTGDSEDGNKNAHETMTQVTNEAYKAAGGVWQSTGRGKNDKGETVDIEILGVGKIVVDEEGQWPWSQTTYADGLQKYYSWRKDQTPTDAEDGENTAQFAELNCEAVGALYQDVLTMNGVELNYQLAHRARGDDNTDVESDTMSVVIMPTQIAKTGGNDGGEIDTQSELERYLGRLTDEEKQELGIYEHQYTSDDQSWHYYRGSYTAKASLTRFFFVAVDTATGDDTVGNFLDAVQFTQDPLKPRDDEFSLTLQKSFEGLGEEDIQEIRNTMKFQLSGKDKNDKALTGTELKVLLGLSAEDEITADDQSITIPGSLLRRYIVDGNEIYRFNMLNEIGKDAPYEISVKEIDAGLEGYNLTTEVNTSVTQGDNEPSSSENAVIEGLQGKTEAVVSFTNIYERSENKTINFTKVWDDAGNKYETRPDSLEVTLKPTIKIDVDGVLVEQELSGDDLGGISLTHTLTAGENWKTSWDVPVYYDHNGAKVKINYTVVEGEVDSDYVYEANSSQALSGSGEDYETQFKDEGITKAESKSKKAVSKAATASVKTNQESNQSEDLGEPNHRKYVEYNESTGDYTLNLDVTGAQGEASGVDVLFVIDTSGSMGSGRGNNDLLPDVKDLLTDENGIIDQIFAADGNVNSVAYVSFAGKSETKYSGWYQEAGAESLKDSINRLRATGGTNWTYAMQRASSALAERENNNNEKVVIFLSDGEPTYSINEWGFQYGSGSSTRSEYYDEAIAAVEESSALSNAKIYSVYLTSGTKEGMKTFADGTGAELINGEEDLSSALEGILEVIIPTYQNVVITDTLSQYVDFVNQEITVTQKTADGTTTELTQDQYSISIDGKSLSVTLLNGDSLTAGTTYTVSFRIKPNATANEEFASSNGEYPHTGGPETGVTSAGEKGFYSNEEGSAKVTYEVNDTPGEAEYEQPVVQVTTHSLTFKKEWNQPSSVEQPVGDVELLVTYTDGTQETIILEESKKYEYVQENVPITRNISTVTELSGFENYEPSYQYSPDRTVATVINNYAKIETQNIVVKKEWKGNGPESDVAVVLYQSVNGGEAKEYKRATLSERTTPKWTVAWKVPVQEYVNGQWIQYSYAVKEVNTPAGYSSSISYEYGEDTTAATITNTYDSNCKDESYYIANALQTEKLEVSKTWDDDGNFLNTRPGNLVITINDGTGGNYEVELSAENSWQKTLTILKKKSPHYSAQENLESEYYNNGEANIVTTNTGVKVSFINTLKSKSIIVKKEWWDGEAEDRPDNIQFKLQYSKDDGKTWEDYGGKDNIYNITAENIIYGDDGSSTPWAMELTNLPINYEYRVVEIMDNLTGYLSSVSQEDNIYTITNTLKWSLKKTNLPEGDETSVELKGAEFELKDINGKLIATGSSGDDGFVTWTPAESIDAEALNQLHGDYTLTETKAPSGYQKLNVSWTLNFENGLLKTAEPNDDSYSVYITISKSAEQGVVITLKNGKLYELPEAGGPGIFSYMIGGILFMVAGSLMIYINRRRGVLKR